MTERLLEVLDPEPGERVLELGAGLGEVGERVAQLVGENGKVVLTDASPGMLQAARERIGPLSNVTLEIADAESTGFGDASFDRTVARFALMLVPNVEAAFAETRRVLRPGGRLAFAVWTEAAENPWGATIGRTLLRLGLTEQPEPDTPGPFRLADPERLRSLVTSARFAEPEVEAVDIVMGYESRAHYWEVTRDVSSMFGQVLERLSASEHDGLRAEIDRALEPYTDDTGVALPGRAWVVAADAV